MIDNEVELIENFDAAQVRFRDANNAGYERGLSGENYVSPFEAIPELCRDRRDKMDRFVAFHYDRGYLTAYGCYLDNHPDAAEDIMFKRLVDRYCLVDKAQCLGTAAYEDGRSGAAVITEVYELLPGPADESNLAIYDGWEFGYLLGMVYDKEKSEKNDWPKFDYDRAYALVNAVESGEDGDVPGEVVSAFKNAREIVEASEDYSLMECLTCPFHYGVHAGDSCDRDCYEMAVTIQTMIGVDDDTIRGWLVHR